MEKFYVTLVRELSGFCIIAFAPNEDMLRRHLAKNYGKLWCGVYAAKPSETVIGDELHVFYDDEE